MDPDEALKKLLEKTKEMQELEEDRGDPDKGLDCGETNHLLELGGEVAELFLGLRGWLANKGFLPRLWRHQKGDDVA